MKNMLLIVCLGITLAANSKSVDRLPIKMIKPVSWLLAFENIHLHKQGAGIKLQWSVSESSTVSSYDIECTYEDPEDIYSNWSVKANIPSSGRKMNMFTDIQDIYAGQVYYRIVAHTTNGDIVSQPQPLIID
jgi:hypothetical protein